MSRQIPMYLLQTTFKVVTTLGKNTDGLWGNKGIYRVPSIECSGELKSTSQVSSSRELGYLR